VKLEKTPKIVTPNIQQLLTQTKNKKTKAELTHRKHQ